ncbi:hypothetical protein BDQ17DRAFT_1320808 [Cyathus striatus]|nr:hypothetical protein BDQ17DRAFT_1320808 [Cyathus striatus]
MCSCEYLVTVAGVKRYAVAGNGTDSKYRSVVGAFECQFSPAVVENADTVIKPSWPSVDGARASNKARSKREYAHKETLGKYEAHTALRYHRVSHETLRVRRYPNARGFRLKTDIVLPGVQTKFKQQEYVPILFRKFIVNMPVKTEASPASIDATAYARDGIETPANCQGLIIDMKVHRYCSRWGAKEDLEDALGYRKRSYASV